MRMDTNQLKMQLPAGFQMPKMPSIQFELLFNDSESIYQGKVDELKKTMPQTSGTPWEGMTVMFENKMSNEKTYINRNQKTSIESKTILDKLFLVKAPLEEKKWKLMNEMDTVAGYTCMKAKLLDDSSYVVAWFTPQIPVSVGPKDFYQLPGAILKLEMDSGRMTLRAINVELKPLESGIIVIPTEGKEVTEAEYKELRKKKMEEMGGNMPGGPMIIQLNH